jgi:hypothetical protein
MVRSSDLRARAFRGLIEQRGDALAGEADAELKAPHLRD